MHVYDVPNKIITIAVAPLAEHHTLEVGTRACAASNTICSLPHHAKTWVPAI